MMTVPSAEELGSLKYSDLQNLAKRLGLRANLRANKLLKALKTHLKQEAQQENKNQDESQAFASSCDETEAQITSGEQAEKEPVDHITKTRRRRKTVHRDPVSQDHSEISLSHFTELQNQEDQENWDLGTTGKISSLPDKSLGEEYAVSSGKAEINANEDSKEPSEKRSHYTDGFSKLGNKKRTAVTTPNFKKLHEAHFKEMESIDEYIKRRKKHHSSHELKQPSRERGVMTPVPPGSLSVACTPASQRRSQGQAQGPARRSAMSLKGSVKHAGLSATKMNVRFSAATKDNEHKRSLTKTPARKSPHVTMCGNTAKGQAVFGTPMLKTNKGNSAAAVITPFKLTTVGTQTPVSSKKPVFDLKASLSRPLNYEPHKGKLKPWGQSKENNSLNEHMSRVSFHKKTYKQPPLQTREEQRKKHEQERKEKKAKVLGARRGLIMVKDK
ncbi:PREDICTED: nucleolar and spindle-associated protein 1 isoform X2 [Chinchilla lanigera]|uniref:nucleolar and spindle-associated protein 1 isoform X2 n=1 Tax=Chinchilla lanigera TaxID=34839 RepID=UPI00038EC3FD|nr:PREDICTED: nucleolar and spindle-associated protein 1 isoform X2 [Chinchilla lanigera]